MRHFYECYEDADMTGISLVRLPPAPIRLVRRVVGYSAERVGVSTSSECAWSHTTTRVPLERNVPMSPVAHH